MGQKTQPSFKTQDRVLRIRLQSHLVHPTVCSMKT